MSPFDRAHTSSYSYFTGSKLCVYLMLFTSALFVESRKFSMYLAAQLGVTALEFHKNLSCQETGVPDMSCGDVRVTIYLAVWIEQRLVTDGRTDGHRAVAYTAP